MLALTRNRTLLYWSPWLSRRFAHSGARIAQADRRIEGLDRFFTGTTYLIHSTLRGLRCGPLFPGCTRSKIFHNYIYGYGLTAPGLRPLIKDAPLREKRSVSSRAESDPSPPAVSRPDGARLRAGQKTTYHSRWTERATRTIDLLIDPRGPGRPDSWESRGRLLRLSPCTILFVRVPRGHFRNGRTGEEGKGRAANATNWNRIE